MRLRLLGFLCLAIHSLPLVAADPVLLSFKTQQLTTEYYSEGAGVGDLNNDGAMDIVYGPHWYAGPGFTEKHEIYAPKPQNRKVMQITSSLGSMTSIKIVGKTSSSSASLVRRPTFIRILASRLIRNGSNIRCLTGFPMNRHN